MRGVIVANQVEVTAEPSDLDSLEEKGFGKRKDSKLLLSLVEAAYLAWRGELEVDGGDGDDFNLILATLCEVRSDDLLRFLVYQDLRRAGRVVRYEENTPFLRLYPKGGLIGEMASNVLVFPISEHELIPQSDIMKAVMYAGRIRKRLLLAVVGSESDITYYHAGSLIPGKIRETTVDSLPRAEGRLTHDRVVVWDPEVSAKLYSNAFWGHPMGVRKPKPDVEHRGPLQLSLVEAVHLSAIGVLRVKTPDGEEVTPADLIATMRRFRAKADARVAAFAYWRNLGYVVKPSASKYGGHYLIYKEGPGIDHAPYLCVVSYPDDIVTPVELIGIGRIATSVNKTLLVSVVDGEDVLNYKVEWEKLPR